VTAFNVEAVTANVATADTPRPIHSVLADLNAREDRLLRIGSGILDEVVFPRLRAMGVSETDLHRTAMHLCRQVQGGRDVNGLIADLLGVTRVGINGTIATSEVV
jgi:hypothetical protein